MSHTLRTALLVAALAAAASGQNGTAAYDVTFTATWSAETHPNAFPPNPHFSPLIGATHDSRVLFWQVGRLASPGIESMAETGSTFLLANEVRAAITAGTADQVVQRSGLGTSPSSRTVRVTVTAEYSRITLVSMLAPSPDWFVGVSGLDLRPGGAWTQDVTVPLHVHDAGTDSGVTYLSPNANTVPPQPIALVSTSSGPFQGRSTLVGSMRFRRVASTSVYGCGVNPPGSMTVDATPVLGSTVTLRLDDPTASVGSPAQSALGFAAGAAPGFPCGTAVPGLGLGGGPGEVLVAAPITLLPGPTWTAAPAAAPVSIPARPELIGGRVHVQGLLLGAAGLGVTDAVELSIGR